MVCPPKAHKDINYDNLFEKPENHNLDLVPTTTHYFKTKTRPVHRAEFPHILEAVNANWTDF